MKNKILHVVLFATTISCGIASASCPNSLLYEERGEAKAIDDPIIINVMKLDWERLDNLVSKDTEMTPSFKTSFRMTQDIYDPVERDRAMRNAPYYDYLKSILYPKAVTETQEK